jgi:hypothetical protein
MKVIKFKVVATIESRDPALIKAELTRYKKLQSQKKWRDKNKEHTSNYNSIYFQANKNALIEHRKQYEKATNWNKNYRAEIIQCICGLEAKRGDIMNHKKVCDTHLCLRRMQSVYEIRPDLFDDNGFCKLKDFILDDFQLQYKIENHKVVKVNL